MEENEAFDPASISRFCLVAIVFEASNGINLVEKFL